jgi:hypothetical protein
VERGITLDHYTRSDSDTDAAPRPRGALGCHRHGRAANRSKFGRSPHQRRDAALQRHPQAEAAVADSDKADLDDQLIVLFRPRELLAGEERPKLSSSCSRASKRLELLQGRVTKKRRNGFVLGGSPTRMTTVAGRPRGVTVVAVQPP